MTATILQSQMYLHIQKKYKLLEVVQLTPFSDTKKLYRLVGPFPLTPDQ